MSAGGQTDATSGMLWLVPIYNHASNESVLTCVLATVYLVRQRYHHMRDIFRKWQVGSSDIKITRTGSQSAGRRPTSPHLTGFNLDGKADSPSRTPSDRALRSREFRLDGTGRGDAVQSRP